MRSLEAPLPFRTSCAHPFLPQKKGAPKPNNPDLFLEDSPATTFYVAQVGEQFGQEATCQAWGKLHEQRHAVCQTGYLYN